MLHSFSFILTQGDMIAAHTLHLKSRGRRPRPIMMSWLIASATLFAMQLGQKSQANWSILLGQAAIGGAIFAILLPLFLPGLMGWYAGRRSLEQRPSLRRKVTVELRPTAFFCQQEHGGEGQTPWQDFVGLRADENVMLLYLSQNLFQIVPKASIAPELQSMIREKIKAKQ